MARMLPAVLDEDTRSAGERRFFACLRDQLPDEIVVLHGVGWIARGDTGVREGEADFVLLDPRGGVLVIEVKGGGISFDPATGWRSTGRSGEFRIKSPVEQARRGEHDIVARLKAARGGPPNRPHVGHAVCFPDTRAAAIALPPDLPRELIIDGDDLGLISSRVDAIWDWWGARPGMGTRGVEHCTNLLRPRIELPALRGVTARAHVEEIVRLTTEQYRVLDMIERIPRASIAGCAGSGKTMLAIEKVRRLARAGDRVLVVCFNVLLSQYLKAELHDEAVTVSTFHGLCRDTVVATGREPPSLVVGDEATYYRELEVIFADAVLDVEKRFDAIVVDEGQDFHDDWWAPLQLLLRDEHLGCLYVFHDAAQQIFQRDEHPAAPPGIPIVLRDNLRSAQTVAAAVALHAPEAFNAAGPAGGDVVEEVYYSEIELQSRLATILRDWVADGIEPAEIAILTPRGPARSAVFAVRELGGVRLVDDPTDDSGSLRCSIHRFKGLERTAVVVCEIGPETRRELLYTGFSRARSMLAILRTAPAGSGAAMEGVADAVPSTHR